MTLLKQDRRLRVVNGEAARYPEPALPCRHCGSMMTYIRQRTAQLRTLLGCVPVKRAYYLCSVCHEGCYPLDRRLGLRPNALSAELERLAAMTGVQLPFEKGRDLFEALTLVSLSDQTVDKATQAYGAKVAGQETAWRAVAYDQAALQQRKRTARRPLRLYGAIDATKVHTHGQDGHLERVIDACLALTRTEDSSDPAFVAARYFDQNRSRMDYPTYRQQGYQIGSGTIESAAKQIGLLRLKVAGAIWNVDSARRVAKARAAYLSHRWPELAAYHSLPLVT